MKRRNSEMKLNVTMYGKEKWKGSGNSHDWGGCPTWEPGNGFGGGCSDGSGSNGYSQMPPHYGWQNP